MAPTTGEKEDGIPAQAGTKRSGELFEYPPKKKVYVALLAFQKLLNIILSVVTDPIVHAGRHFGRTVNAVIPMRTLVASGLCRMVKIKLEKTPLEDFPIKFVQIFLDL